MVTPPPYALGRHPTPALFAPLLLLLAAFLVLVATLPFTDVRAMRVPGAHRLQAVIDLMPQPWKPARPAYVAPPPSDSPDTRLRAEALTAAAPAMAPAVPAVPAAPAAFAVVPAPASVRLEGVRHQWQTWNNCGPATVTMATSFYGRAETQVQSAAFLKPNANDKNVGPDELVAYVRSLGLRADHRVAGDTGRIKLLLANGVPVLAEFWLTPKPNDGLGHYRLLTGYDDAAGRWTGYDSFVAPGVNVATPFAEFDAGWRVFNRTYIPVYPAEKADVVAAILGDDADSAAMWERALAVAQQEAAARPNDPYGWFNAGTSLVALGRTSEAVPVFDRARTLQLPWRMLWYQFGPFEAYLAEGRAGDVLTLTAANLQQANDLEESHYYRGRALLAHGQTAAARQAYGAALRANPRYEPARQALTSLG